MENAKDLVGIFERTVDIRIDEASFALMNTMLTTFPVEVMKPYYATIFTCIFRRLQADKTTRKGSNQFSRNLLYFLSIFINLYGVPQLIASTDQIQPGIFMMLLNSEADKIGQVEGRKQRKEVVAAFSKLVLGAELAPPLFTQVLEGLVKLVELEGRRNFGAWEEELDTENMQRMKHQQLYNAVVEDQYVGSASQDEKNVLMSALAGWEAKTGRGISTVVGETLGKETMGAIKKFVTQTNILIH